MKKKTEQIPIFHKLVAEIVAKVGPAYCKNKINYYEAIGVFEAAKQIFIDIENGKAPKEGE